MELDDFTRKIVEIIKQANEWHRVVSIDVETKVLSKDEFLTNEAVLGIGIAWRSEGKVETRAFMLEAENQEAEVAMLNSVAASLQQIRPLILIGYNISGYDFPLLNWKLKKYNDYLAAKASPEKPVFPREYWALKDALTRSYILDVMHPLRYAIAEHDKTTPKYISLEKVIAHPLFSSLPLMRKKHLTHAEDKGKYIYELWQRKDPSLLEYLKGDVHDTLLIAERLFGVTV